MSDKTNHQLTLPFEVLSNNAAPQYAEIVKQNWQVTFSRQKMGSVYSKRVMGLIASLIKESGDVQEYYQITADKIIRDTDLSSRSDIYKTMKNVVYELSEVCFYLEDEESGRVVPRHLLDTTRFDNPAGYYGGKLTVAFNPQLKGVVQNLAHFSQYELKRYINFKSWYTMRLYEMLEAYRDKTHVEWGIEKYRDMMGCGARRNSKGERIINPRTGKFKYEKYAQHSDAITYTTKEPIKELKGTDLGFEVSPVYAEGSGRGRRPIEKVRFKFTTPPVLPSDKIKGWLAKSDGFKSIYPRLRKYGVTDAVIAKHAEVIGGKKLNSLLHEWDLRQQPDSPNKIANPEKYCNRVIKEVAGKIRGVSV